LKVYNNPFVGGINLLARIISPKQWAEALVQGAPYKKAEKIVAISGMVKRDIIKRFGIPEERIVVICTGVDIQRFSPENRRFREEIRGYHGISSGEKVCLFSSHNFRLKGLICLIRALGRVKKKAKIKLLVLGRGRKGSYERLARRLGCEKDIFFAGEVENPERYYGAADFLAHPTFYDSWSRVVLEAPGQWAAGNYNEM